MFRRCVMSQVRRLTTASSREHQTYLNRTPPQPLTTYRSHIPPLTPFNQLLVFRSLSTVTPPNHEDGKGKDSEANSKGSEPASESFDDWINNINIYNGRQLMEFIRTVFTLRFAFMFGKMMKKKYDDNKHVKRIEVIDSILKYEITGLRGAYDKSVTVEIRNNRQLVVSGRTYRSDGSAVVIERHVTLPYNDYSKAKKRATFYPDVGWLVVEIYDYKKAQDIKIEVQETKA